MKFPPPGRLVDVGGRRLHLFETGSRVATTPTVILEAGLAATSLSWATVQPLIAKFARVASYDRAGLGWSDERSGPATALAAARDLETLLERSGLPAPYVLVGHSLGGLIVRIFQQLRPELVAALVLVDPVVRAEWGVPAGEYRRALARAIALSRRGETLARLGVVRLALRALLGGSERIPSLLARLFAGDAASVGGRLVGEVRKIPRDQWPVIAAHWSEDKAFRTMANYLENLPASVGELDESRDLGSLPIVILSSGNQVPDGLAEHIHDAGLSTHGEQLVVPATGHWINLDAPETIAAAVKRVIGTGPQ